MSVSLARLTSFAETLERQQNVASRAQLLAAGIDDMTMYRRTRSGDWQRLLPGVYLISPAPISTEQRRTAAALYAPDAAQLTGMSALHWYGFRHAPATEKVHLLIPHETRRRSAGFVVVQRTHALDEHPRAGGLYVVASPARAVVDASRASGDLRTVRAVMAEAVQSRHVRIDDLEREIRRAKRSRTAIAARVLIEIIDGVRSSPEAELRDIAESIPTIPLVLWNPVLFTLEGERLPSPDGLIPDAGIALEVDSREHHADDEGWARTLWRHNILSERGLLNLHFTPVEIRREPRRLRRVLERTYENRMANPPTLDLLIGDPSYTESVNRVPLLAPRPGGHTGRRSSR